MSEKNTQAPSERELWSAIMRWHRATDGSPECVKAGDEISTIFAAALATQQAVQGEPKDSPPVYAQLVISNCAALKTLLRNMLDAEQMDCGVEAMLDQVAEGVEEAMGDAYAQGRQDQLDQDREDFTATPPATGQVERDREDAENWRYIRRKLCLTGNGDGTCTMQAVNLPAAIQGWPESGQVAEFCDAAIRAARSSEGGQS